MRGKLIIFEGIDQSGKATQARLLAKRLTDGGRRVLMVSFPDYQTPIGTELYRALHGERSYGPEVIQMLMIANRYEWKPSIERELAAGAIVVCDRYIASGIVYGEALGLDGGWLTDAQRYLPQPDLNIFVDVSVETAVARKSQGRDVYEQDKILLRNARLGYSHRAEVSAEWRRVDGDGTPDAIAANVWAIVAPVVEI